MRVCVCDSVYEWVCAWEQTKQAHLMPILMSMTAGSSNSLSKSVISTYTDGGRGVKDSLTDGNAWTVWMGSDHGMDSKWIIAGMKFQTGYNYWAQVEILCSFNSHQRDEFVHNPRKNISTLLNTIRGHIPYPAASLHNIRGMEVSMAEIVCTWVGGGGGKADYGRGEETRRHGYLTSTLPVSLLKQNPLKSGHDRTRMCQWIYMCDCITSQMGRILPSSCSTTFLNSGANGLKTSSIIALRALRSFASDFFIIVPLSSPALKFPVWQEEGDAQSSTKHVITSKVLQKHHWMNYTQLQVGSVTKLSTS